jgi:uncharacterized protein YjbJ (UPF0337 family)
LVVVVAVAVAGGTVLMRKRG